MNGRRSEGGPWRAAQAARPLHAWTLAQLDTLAAALRKVMARWQEAWGLVPGGSVDCAAATPEVLAAGVWRGLRGGKNGAAWLCLPADTRAVLARALFAEPAPEPGLAAAAAEACMQDVLGRVCAALDLALVPGAEVGPMAAVAPPWSGAVAVSMTGPFAWQVVADAAVMQAWIAGQPPGTDAAQSPRSPLCPLADALASRRMALQVRLRGCELDLGALQGLQVGDVVRLAHGLQEPADLADDHGCAVLSGHLGRRAACKAVELARLPSGPATTQG